MALSAPRTTTFTWDPVGEVPEVLSSAVDGDRSDFVYGEGREAALGVSTSQPFSNDVFGSSVATPATEAWSLGSAYDAWGAPSVDPQTAGARDLAAGSTAASDHTPRFGFRGELHDAGLIHLRARDYAPSAGRFTSRDPLDGTAGDVGAYNLYPYVGSDPLGRVDPSGMCKTLSVAKVKDVRQWLKGSVCPPPKFAAALGYEPKVVQTPYGRRAVKLKGMGGGDGCTVGPDVGANFDFTYPCGTHDYGYDLIRYGARRKRDTIDRQFKTDMLRSCESTRPRWYQVWRYRHEQCEVVAEGYYRAVRAGGFFSDSEFGSRRPR